jgi:hypothetical protein
MKHSLLVTEIDRDWNILKLKLERQELSSEIDNTEELFLLLKELENYLSVIGRILPPLAIDEREILHSSQGEENTSDYKLDWHCLSL